MGKKIIYKQDARISLGKFDSESEDLAQLGGYTKNGITEAVLIGSINAVPNKNINQLLQFFGNKSWIKIK